IGLPALSLLGAGRTEPQDYEFTRRRVKWIRRSRRLWLRRAAEGIVLLRVVSLLASAGRESGGHFLFLDRSAIHRRVSVGVGSDRFAAGACDECELLEVIGALSAASGFLRTLRGRQQQRDQDGDDRDDDQELDQGETAAEAHRLWFHQPSPS